MKSKKTLSLSESRKQLFGIVKDVQKPGHYYTLTENGVPKAVILSAEEFESIIETIDVLSDPESVKRIDEAEQAYARGEYISWRELKKELSLVPEPAAMVADKSKTKYGAKPKKKRRR